MFDPARAVEITAPKYGSAYRIGGHLLLTASHLFEDSSKCKVRSKQSANPFEVEAAVVWRSSDADVALVALPDTLDRCSPAVLGVFPEENNGAIIPFELYGWPEWAFTKYLGSKFKAGGRHICGKIYLADYSPDSLLVLEPERVPTATSNGDSPWKGCSGAAVICGGFVVAVQRQHQRTDRPASLEAELLSKVSADLTWQSLLKAHGINPQPQLVRLGGGATSSPSYLQAERIPSVEQEMAAALQRLNYDNQQEIFDDFLDGDRVAEAFAVAVAYDIEADLQKCLVSRLSRSLMGGKPPEFCPLGVDRSWRKNPTSELLQRLAPSLGLNATASMIEVHQSIAQLCQTQSVVIALYGVPNMGSKLSTLLDEFWNPLVAMLHESLEVSHRGRLLLFLAGDKPEEDWVRQSSLVCLEPPLAQIMTAEVHRWGRLPEVQQFKNRCQKEARLLDLDKLRSSSIGENLGANAYEAMELICDAFGFQDGLAPFEPFWKLSGDLAA